MSTSRDVVLGRIRSALASEPPRPQPEVPTVWPLEGPQPEAMATRFAQELQLVSGEVIRAGTMEAAQLRLADLAREGQWSGVGAVDRPLVREVIGSLAPGIVSWDSADARPADYAGLSAAVIEADHLLADTGSSVVVCGTAWQRLMCYLPPVCVVVATLDRLVEHLPAAWEALSAKAADPATRGEFVLITGPSRTADIEKILILGVHGPQRLVVLLIG